ncbi:MAG: ribosome assembly RNA-binding protein YhbY [Lachnospiraceae bacterium]|nr:ribosome assembly RNA-binding protein YhbY [Lachnospiraceae bacterium]
MTSKQRAYLRGLAMPLDPIFQLGKYAVTPEFTQAVDEALAKRELVKLSVLKSCDEDPYELADILAGRTHSEVVQVIGRRFVLYRPAKKPMIELPRDKKSNA